MVTKKQPAGKLKKCPKPPAPRRPDVELDEDSGLSWFTKKNKIAGPEFHGRHPQGMPDVCPHCGSRVLFFGPAKDGKIWSDCSNDACNAPRSVSTAAEVTSAPSIAAAEMFERMARFVTQALLIALELPEAGVEDVRVSLAETVYSCVRSAKALRMKAPARKLHIELPGKGPVSARFEETETGRGIVYIQRQHTMEP